MNKACTLMICGQYGSGILYIIYNKKCGAADPHGRLGLHGRVAVLVEVGAECNGLGEWW